MCRSTHVWVFNFEQIGESDQHFFENHGGEDGFFKNGSQLQGSRLYFWSIISILFSLGVSAKPYGQGSISFSDILLGSHFQPVEIFFYLDGGRWMVGGGWAPTFLVFSFHYNTMMNTLNIGTYFFGPIHFSGNSHIKLKFIFSF